MSHCRWREIRAIPTSVDTVEQIRDYVATLSDRVDDVHRAAGGKGLKVCDLEILDGAVVTAGVRQ